MRIHIHRLSPTLTIEEFADQNELEMDVYETEYGYRASFRHGEIKEGSILCSISGRGETFFEAIQDYAANISGKLLIINAGTARRREIPVPKLKLLK